jgi:hypothetical protein
MSPTDQAFWMRVNRRAATMVPEVARRVLQAFAALRASLSDEDLAQLIESGALTALLSQAALDIAFGPVRSTVYRQVEKNVGYFARDVPGAGKINGTIAVAFDQISPDVIEALKGLDTRVFQSLQDDIREGVRAFVEQGYRNGDNPRTIAKELRSIIGMSPTQIENQAKREAAWLEEGRPARAVDRMVAAYGRRAIALNAETTARTATLDAMKQGQRLAWLKAQEAGIVTGPLTQTWRGVLDTRERVEHLLMEGETVPFDTPYSNGEVTPGESTFNCRCLSIIRAA